MASLRAPFFVFNFLILCLFKLSSLSGASIEPITGHAHEAFMTNEAPITLLQAIEQAPPEPLKENQPAKPDADAVWVSGYWNWSKEHEKFVWCSGGWRVPPPGHIWISGFWKEFDEGWVRLQGFWSEKPLEELVTISQTPPDPVNETPSNRPSEDDFWMAGYWKFEKGKFVWYRGKWEKTDRDWIYVPPKYVWRSEGFLFVPAYWDWPLEERGTAYTCLNVDGEVRQIDYGPEWVVQPFDLLQGCLLYYPDYCYFYFYYSHFHPHWWGGCDSCPPWWVWDWWWMPWQDQWALWWWWATPGYPAPIWLAADVIALWYGPPAPFILLMQQIAPPLMITPFGVVSPADLIQALGGKGIPIFPIDLSAIQEQLGENLEEGSVERPGSTDRSLEELEKQVQPLPETTVPPKRTKPGEHPPTPELTPPVVEPPVKPSLPPRPKPPIRRFEPTPVEPEAPPIPTPPQHRYPPQVPRLPEAQPDYHTPRPPQWQTPQQPNYPNRPRPNYPNWTPPSREQPNYPPQQSRPQIQPPQWHTPPRTTPPTMPEIPNSPNRNYKPYYPQNQGSSPGPSQTEPPRSDRLY